MCYAHVCVDVRCLKKQHTRSIVAPTASTTMGQRVGKIVSGSSTRTHSNVLREAWAAVLGGRAFRKAPLTRSRHSPFQKKRHCQPIGSVLIRWVFTVETLDSVATCDPNILSRPQMEGQKNKLKLTEVNQMKVIV